MEKKRKTVLVISHYFWPEDFKINELVFDLSKKYEVSVLTGNPSYPSKNYFKNFIHKKIKNLKIYRVPVFRRSRTNLSIFLNYLSFLFTLPIFGLFYLKDKNFDFIFVYQPSPITVGIAGVIIKFFKKSKMALWVNDLWPDTLNHVNLPFVKNLKFIFTIITNYIYKNTDYILVQSNSFKKKIRNKNFKKKIIFFPNWIDTTKYKKQIIEVDKKKILTSNVFKLMYIGNIGHSQDFMGILKILKIIKEKKIPFKFIVIGDGRDKLRILEEVKRLNLKHHIYFFGRINKEYIRNYSKFTDMLFLSLKRNELFKITIPAKLQTYLSLNKPIFGLISGETSKLISSMCCGIVADSGNYNDAAKKIIKIIKNKNILKNYLSSNTTLVKKQFYFKKIYNDLINLIDQK
tara:strand:- start:427 stop:1635 length:1209 start_codon:yes stop_codon:yes gene_type:complete